MRAGYVGTFPRPFPTYGACCAACVADPLCIKFAWFSSNVGISNQCYGFREGTGLVQPAPKQSWTTGRGERGDGGGHGVGAGGP